jgi:hypothetical protein
VIYKFYYINLLICAGISIVTYLVINEISGKAVSRNQKFLFIVEIEYRKSSFSQILTLRNFAYAKIYNKGLDCQSKAELPIWDNFRTKTEQLRTKMGSNEHSVTQLVLLKIWSGVCPV